ncbi:hypothetical protein GYB59_07740 [bacterium]|nr:hypothetical protein [bacterium]
MTSQHQNIVSLFELCFGRIAFDEIFNDFPAPLIAWQVNFCDVGASFPKLFVQRFKRIDIRNFNVRWHDKTIRFSSTSVNLSEHADGTGRVLSGQDGTGRVLSGQVSANFRKNSLG